MDDLARHAHGQQADDQHGCLGHEETPENAADHSAVLAEQQRARGQALNHERAQQNGRQHIPRHSQNHHGNERPARDS